MKKKHLNPTILNVLRLWLVFAMLFQLSGTALAYTWTDKPDYSPGETVTIHGDNSDGAGYLADEPIFVEVWGPNGFHVSSEPDNPTADANGAWSWQLTLWDTEAAVGDYTYTATGLTSNVSQSGTFTDAYSYQITNLAPSAGTCGSTITASAILQRCTTGACTWYPLSNRVLSFGFSTVPGLPGSWIPSGNTDTSGRAEAAMLVPPGAKYLYARHAYAFSPSTLYVYQGVQFTVTPAASVTTVTVSDALYDGNPHGATAVVTGCGLNQSLPVTYEGRNTTTYGPSTTPPTGAGDYTASASFAGDSNNSPSSDSKNFTITGDMGALGLAKSLTGGPAGYTGPFTIHYDCGVSGSGDRDVYVGSPVIISGIPTGTTCTVSEPGLPAPPTGYSFGAPTYDPTNGQVTIAAKDTSYTVTTYNTLVSNTGSLRITKTVDAGGSGFTTGSFGVHVDCTNPTNVYDTTVSYPTPGDVTIPGIPSGSVCTVTETSKEAAPTGYSWDTETITGSPATIGIGTTVDVTVANKLTLIPAPALTLLKQISASSTGPWWSSITVASGSPVYYQFTINNTGNVPLSPVSINDPNVSTANCSFTDPLPAGGTTSCVVGPVTAATLAGTYPNTATAHGVYSGTTYDSQPSNADYIVDILPDISVTKTANPTAIPETGGSVVFTFVVTNHSSESFTLTSLADDKFGNLNGQGDCVIPQTLAAGGNYTCSITKSLTGNAGASHTNVVTASGTDPQGNPDSATAGATVTFTNVLPTVTLNKSTDVEFLDEPGGDFTFTLLVTNTSAEAVTITALTDTQSADAVDFAACTALIGTTLAAGTSAPCSYVVSHTDVGGWENTAEVVVTDNDETTGTATDTQFVSVFDVPPTVSLEKLVDITTLPEPGGAFHFTLRITNTSVEPVLITALTDDNLPTEWFPDYVGVYWMNPDEVLDIPYTVNHSDAMTYGNIASVTVEDNEGTPVSARAEQSVEVTDVPPTVTLVKSVDVASMAEPGGVFNFTLTITNNSPETVWITELTDTNTTILSDECLSLVSDNPPYTDYGLIPAGESVSCMYSVTHTEAGTYYNTASVKVIDNELNEATATANQTVTVTNVAPDISVTKTANPTAVAETGGSVVFTYVVTNNSSIEAATITVLSDDKFGALAGDADCKVGTALVAGASCTFDAAFTVPAGDYPGSHVNVFTATAKDNENTTATATANATVTFTDVLPDITVTKTANPTAVPETGGNVVFTFRVTNNSAEAAIISSLSDSVYGILTGDTDCNVGTTVMDYCEFSITRFVSGDFSGAAHHNVFTGKATDNDGNEDTATDDATVTFSNVLPTVELDKSVDVEFLDEPGGDFTFTLDVTNTSAEEVTITALTDSQSGDAVNFGACAALIGTKLAAGASTSCTYVVTHTDVAPGGGSYDNTADVTVEDNEGSQASASDSQMVWVDDLRPTVMIEKLVDITTLPEPGGDFHFTLRITNTSVEPVTIWQLVDTNLPTYSFDEYLGTSLQPNQVLEIPYTVSHTDAMIYGNWAEVTVEDNEGTPVSARAEQSVEVTNVDPTVTLAKSVTPSTLPEPGGVFNFKLTVTNTSVEPVQITDFYDEQCPVAGGYVGDWLDPGQVLPIDCPVTHTNVGVYNNTASITVMDNELYDATATASASVTVTDVKPAIAVTKVPSPAEMNEPGGEFTFTYVVTNNSVEQVTVTSVTDSVIGTITLPADVILAPGESTVAMTGKWTYTEAGAYPNTVTAKAVDNESNEATATASASVTVTDVKPAIAVTKVPSPAEMNQPGGEFTFTYVVTNNSVEQVTVTSVTDSVIGTITLPADVILAPGESTAAMTGKWTYTEAGAYPNTVTAKAVDNESNEATATASASVTVTDVKPTIAVTKVPSPAEMNEPGGEFTFTYVVTNNSVEQVTVTSVTDSVIGTITLPADVILAPGESTAAMTGKWTYTEAGAYPNTVTAKAVDNESNEATATASASVTVTDVPPTVDLIKSVTPDTRPEPGGVFNYTLTVHNTSAEAVTIKSLSDTNLLSLECEALINATIAAGGTASCSYTVTQADAGTYPNTASVTVRDNDGSSASASDDRTVTVTNVDPVIAVTKTASEKQVFAPGENVEFTVVVTNNSVATDPVTITSLVDSIHGNLNGQGTCAVPQTIQSGNSYTCKFTVLVDGDETNRVDASGADNESTPVTAYAEASVEMINPSLTIVKTTNGDDGLTFLVGTPLTWSYLVTNNGDVPLTNITVSDDKFVDAICTIETLAAGASTTCTATGTAAAGPYTNLGSAAAAYTDLDGDAKPLLASDGSSYFGAAPALSLVKTADPTTYNAKDQTITYSYVIKNTGNVTLSGPFSVTDDKATVTCTQPADAALSPNEETTCTASYTITQTDLDAGKVTNKATATASFSGNTVTSNEATATVNAIQTPALSLTKSANPTIYSYPGQVIIYTYVVKNTGNVTLSGPFKITDNKLGSFQCGTATSLAPGASITCTKSYTIKATDIGHLPDSITKAATATDLWESQTRPLCPQPNSITNTATATGKFGTTTVTSNQATATVTQVASTSKITPTATTCQMYRDGRAWDYTTAYYNVSWGKIGSVAPGVIFYYSTITAPASTFTLSADQFNTSGSPKWPPMGTAQVILWNKNCVKFPTVTTTADPLTGKVTLNVTGATAGATYFLSVKYNPNSLTGTAVRKPYPTVSYTFVTSLNGAALIPSWDSIAVKPK